MSKILFANAYFYRFDEKQWKTKQPYPPLGTLYAASVMRSSGHAVDLFDTNLIEEVKSLGVMLDDQQPEYFVIYDDGFNYLTKMCLTRMRDAAFEMIKMGKQSGCTVIVCSSDSTDHYEEYLDQGADYIIHGEGEMTLLELVTAMDQKSSTKQILGVSYKSNEDYIKNPARPVLRDLDELPMPAWDLVDMEPYRKIWMDGHRFFSLNLATTRGCPYKCNWCAKPIYGNRYNSRSPEKVIEEIEYLMNAFDVQYFWMCDDIFGLKPGWATKFNTLVQERELKFKYKIQSRVDLLLKEDNIQSLAASGLDMAWLGAESGSQKILDAMDKGTQVSQIYEATKLLQSHGVKVAFFLQFGYLGETMEDIQKTINMVLDIMPDEIGISVSYPLPGTKFYEKVKEDLILKSNWSDSDDLDMMFNSTYNKDFYRTLHRYMHNRYRIKYGIQSMKKLLSNPLKANRKKMRDTALLLYHIPTAATNKYRLMSHAQQTS